MHQIVVTILCRLCPPVAQAELALFQYRENPFFPWEVLLFLQDLLHKSTGFPDQEIGGTKWWPSIRCMFDSR